MKILATVLAGCALALTSISAPAEDMPEGSTRGENWSHVAEHTYMVETVLGSGSGWAWDEDTIITCAHVISEYELNLGITILHQGASLWEVTHITILDDMDAVLLDVKGPELNVPCRAKTYPRPGQWISMGGHPFGNYNVQMTRGWVSGFWGQSYEGSGEWAVDGAIIPGMSGGPVFNRGGHVVGMHVATTIPPGRALGIILAVQDIADRIAHGELGQTLRKREGNLMEG